MIYRDTQIKITSYLKGTLEANSQAQVDIIVRKVYPIGWEATPKAGSSYIFFIKKIDGNEYEAIKILDATEDNIKNVIELIAGTPIPTEDNKR